MFEVKQINFESFVIFRFAKTR